MLEFESQGETRVKVAERADGGEQNSFSGCGFDLRVDAAHVNTVLDAAKILVLSISRLW